MRKPIWAYGCLLLAVIGAGGLLAMNVSAALGGDPDTVSTATRVGCAVAGDLAAACLPPAFWMAHRRGLVAIAAFLVVMWLGGCLFTVYSAATWYEAQVSAARSPGERGNWEEATARATYQQEISAAVERQKTLTRMLGETRGPQAISSLSVQLKDVASELKRLRENPPPPPAALAVKRIVPAFSDQPWLLPLLLLLAGQAGWIGLSMASHPSGDARVNEVAAPAPPPAKPRAPSRRIDTGLTHPDAGVTHPDAENVLRFDPGKRQPPSAEDVKLAKAANGGSNRRAAHVLGISEATVRRILAKSA